MNRDLRPRVGALQPPMVVTAVKVTVAGGGAAGTVRVQGMAGTQPGPSDPVAFEAPKLGPEATLPAEPGVYTLPAPHVHAADLYATRIGLVQETGGHMIVNAEPCTPAEPAMDPCQTLWIDGWPGGDRAGAQLALEPVLERDRDRDLRGDQTEDRTDLRLRATTARRGDGLQITTIEVTNAGPLPADLPVMRASVPDGHTAEWESGCSAPMLWLGRAEGSCSLAPLAVGETRAVVLRSDVPKDGRIRAAIEAEGSDLAPADNVAVIGAAGAQATPALAVTAARKQPLRRGLKLKLTGSGPTRITASFTVRGRTVRLTKTVTVTGTRTVTLKATGAKLRTLRRAVARTGSLRARVVVRGPEGQTATTTTHLT